MNHSQKSVYTWSLSPHSALVKAGVDAGGVLPSGQPPPPGPLLVAVSGGGDSTALLHILHSLAPDRGWRLAAAHVDHGLRPDSGRDADFVRGLAAELGLEFIQRRVEVRARGLSPEDAARRARRRALVEMADQIGAGAIALGHTADDQAETLLARVLTGAGPTGLAGMRPFSPPFWRPLLAVRRRELRQYLEQGGLAWREDPSNQELGPLRNRVRRKLMPLAEELVNPRAVEALGRLARLCADEEDYWREQGLRDYEALLRPEGTSLRLETGALAQSPPALLRRLIRMTAQRLTGDPQGLLMHHVERIMLLMAGPAGRRLNLPGGLLVFREHGALRFDLESSWQDFTCRLDGPGWVWLPPLRQWLAVETGRQPDKLEARGPSAWLPAGRVAWPLVIRPPRPGERFRPLGAPGSKRLSRFLIDRKAPLWRRRRTVVVADRRGIWWAGPWSPAERARKKPGESDWLSLRLVDTFDPPSYT